MDDDLGGDNQEMDEDEPAPAQSNGTLTSTHRVHSSARGDARSHRRGHGDDDNDDDDDDDDALIAAMDVEAMVGENATVRGGRRDHSTHSSSRSATTTQARAKVPVATVIHNDDDDDDFDDDYDALLALEREEATMVTSKSATEPNNAPVALKRRRLSVERNKHMPAAQVNGGGSAISTSVGPPASAVAARPPPIQELDSDTAVTLDVALDRCATLNSVACLVVVSTCTTHIYCNHLWCACERACLCVRVCVIRDYVDVRSSFMNLFSVIVPILFDLRVKWSSGLEA